jgi:hypothetical protein
MIILGLNVAKNDETSQNIAQPPTTTWQTDSNKDEITKLMKCLRVDNSEANNSLECWIEEMRKISENNLFAKKVIEEIDKTNYSKLENYEKDFLDFYIKKVVFDENVYNQKVSENDSKKYYGNITNVYKANYNNEYPDISKTLLIRFEKNQKTSDSFEYYVSFISNDNIKIETNFFKNIQNGSTFYFLYSKNVMNITEDSVVKNYPITIEEVNINQIESLINEYNDFISFMIEYRDTVYKISRNEELQDEYQEIKNEETLSKSIPKIGMTSSEVEKTSWGTPDKKNKNTYSWGTTEQWVYNKYGYVYFENGIVTSVSER